MFRHWLAKHNRSKKVNADCAEPSAAQIGNEHDESTAVDQSGRLLQRVRRAGRAARTRLLEGRDDASPLTVSCAGRHSRSNSLIKAHQPDGVAHMMMWRFLWWVGFPWLILTLIAMSSATTTWAQPRNQPRNRPRVSTRTPVATKTKRPLVAFGFSILDRAGERRRGRQRK